TSAPARWATNAAPTGRRPYTLALHPVYHGASLERQHSTNFLWRATVITHRYLGVAIGLLMVMWFVSGIVMMYVPFPQVKETERLRFLPPISWQACCQCGTLSDQTQVLRVQVESHLGAPALRLRALGQLDSLYDLAHGARVPIDAD